MQKTLHKLKLFLVLYLNFFYPSFQTWLKVHVLGAFFHAPQDMQCLVPLLPLHFLHVFSLKCITLLPCFRSVSLL